MAYRTQSLFSFYSIPSVLSPFSGSPNSPSTGFHAKTRGLNARQRRDYAQHAPRPEIDPEDPTWPNSPLHEVPTPYEIFRQKKAAPYSKRRFYELVKIYHPDRDIHQCSYPGRASCKTRLERYRLIIAANEILSDPAKRRAYDRWGAGWHGMPQMTVSRNARDPARDDPAAKFYDDYATSANNATWEDWERWYRRRDGDARGVPRYVSNERFVGLVILFILIGGSLELGRAARMSAAFKEQVEARHAAVSEDLVRRRQALEDLGGKDARVQDFLRTRDTGYRSSGVPSAELRAQSPNSGWK
jgi:DnaJ domain